MAALSIAEPIRAPMAPPTGPPIAVPAAERRSVAKVGHPVVRVMFKGLWLPAPLDRGAGVRDFGANGVMGAWRRRVEC